MIFCLKKGVTLIEIVIIMIIFAIGVPPLLLMISNVTQRTAEGEIYYQGIVLGRDLMEEILCKRFDENGSSPWSSVLGPDAGETTVASYDDIDDYDGYTDIINGYTRIVQVHYVDPDSAPSSCLNGVQTNSLDCYKPDTDNYLDYKRIDITVRHRFMEDLYLSCIISKGHTAK